MKQRLLLALLMLFSSVGFMKVDAQISITLPKTEKPEDVTITFTSSEKKFKPKTSSDLGSYPMIGDDEPTVSKDGATATYKLKTKADDKTDLSLSNKKTSFENLNIGAVYATNEQLEDTLNIELINFNGLDFDFAKTETCKQGFLISDITFNFYFNALKEKYPKYESNEIILMIKNNLKYKVYDNIYELCGVYKSSINEIYKDNFNVIMDNILMREALYSYGFMCQNVFIPYDEANANNSFYHIVLNTEYNRNVLQKDIHFEMFYNFTLLNNNGTSDFWILYSANGNLYFAIAFVVAAIVYLIVVSTGYYNGENKRFLVSRIAGQSRSSQTNKYLLFNSIWVSIFYFISAAISSLIVYICQILITNSTIFSITNVFIFSPYLILIYVLLIGFSALIYYILYYKLLSPKDISKQLYKIKQK